MNFVYIVGDVSFANLVAILTSACCCFCIMVVMAIIAFKLLVGKGPAPTERLMNVTRAPLPPPGSQSFTGTSLAVDFSDIITSVTDDGFYVYNESLAAGSLIFFRYRSKGRWVENSAAYLPGVQGHFISVGCTPRELQVTRVVPLGAPDYGPPVIEQTIVSDDSGISPATLVDAPPDPIPPVPYVPPIDAPPFAPPAPPSTGPEESPDAPPSDNFPGAIGGTQSEF